MSYNLNMDFEWDGTKSEACFAERGFDFAYAARAFFDPGRTVHDDTRHSYGEERYQLMGMIEQRLYVVVYTHRQDAMRIISARKANQREVKHYEDCTRDG
ncbi:MAG: BrnT family toxin [Gallionella sp.]